MRKFLSWLFRRRRVPTLDRFDSWTRPSRPCNLVADQIAYIHENMECPYCRSGHGLFEGPRGGASLNLFCGNPDCDSRFNVVDPKFGFVPIGQFTGPCPPEFIAGRRRLIRMAH